MTKKEELQKHDLGLSYEEALHGVQTTLAYGYYDRSMESKHMRVGVDMQKSDTLGLVCLLLDKGIITEEEYVEYLRLAANAELDMREQANPGVSFR